MQQIPFIDLFKSAVHVSGDKLAPSSGALFDCIYRFWYNAPIFAADRSAYIQSKSAPEDGRVCSPKHVELI